MQVTLGNRQYDLVPQRIGRIRKRLASVFTLADVAGGDSEALADGIGDQLYNALEVFIPDLAPRHELAGYATAEDYDRVRGHAAELTKARDAYAAGVRPFAEASTDAGETTTLVPDESVTWGDLDERERAGFEEPPFDDPYDEARDKSPTPPEIIEAIQAIFTVHGGDRLVRLLGSVIGPETIRTVLRNELIRWERSRIARSPAGGSQASTSSTTSDQTPAPSPDNGQPTGAEQPASAA